MVFKESREDICKKSLYTALLAELLGTMMLVIFACGSTNLPTADMTQVALCFGLTIASVIWAIGRVSGANINPAVTIALLVTRRISIVRGLLYFVVQFVGGILGALILKSLSPVNAPIGAVARHADINVSQAFFIELLTAYMLIIVIFSQIDGQRTDVNGSIPLTIGLAATLNICWAGGLTGAGFNPARAAGPYIIRSVDGSNVTEGEFVLVYILGPLLGAMVAAIMYEFLFAVNATPQKLKGYFSLNYDTDYYDARGLKARNSAQLQDAEEIPIK